MSFYAKHSVTGKIAEYPDHYRDHPVLSAALTEVSKAEANGCADCGLPPVEVSEETPVAQSYSNGSDYYTYDPDKD